MADEPPARQHLVATGERLLGDGGFEGLAMHKVARAAGQANTYAVQYHFGDRDGLIRAIFTTRLKNVKQRRVDLLDHARRQGLLGSVTALLEVIYIPLSEQVDELGRHSYARFMLQYYSRPLANQVDTDALIGMAGPIDEIFEALGQILRADPEDVRNRLKLLMPIIFWALIERDNFSDRGMQVPPLATSVKGAVAVIESALSAAIWPPISGIYGLAKAGAKG